MKFIHHLCLIGLIFCNYASAMQESWIKKIKLETDEIDWGQELLEAAKKGNLDQVNFLLELGAPLDQDDACGRTALHWAVWEDQPEILEALIDAGANVNICLGWTPSVLQATIFFDRTAMLPAIIAAGADVRFFINDSSNSPLGYAAFFGRTKIAELLVEEMLTIPDFLQKKRMCVFLNCLNRNYSAHYSNLRHIFKNVLRALIKEENVTNPESFVRRQVDKLKVDPDTDMDEGDDSEKIKQHLLSKYFRN
jgi:hypothetical protein